MHPLLFVAGVGVSAAGLIARSIRRDKRMWEALEDAAGTKAYVTKDWPGRREVAFPTGVTFALSGGQRGPIWYDVEATADLPNLPSFRISDDRHWYITNVVPSPLGEGLKCGTPYPRAVAGFIDDDTRRRLRALQGNWLMENSNGKLRVRWAQHSLTWRAVPPERLLRAVRIVGELSTRGENLLEPFARLDGASREDGGVLLAGVHLRIVWWNTGTATVFTLPAAHDADPFVVNWNRGERTGPFPGVASPSFDTALLRFDGEALHLTVPGAEPHLAEARAEYLHRLLRAMSAGSSPFR